MTTSAVTYLPRDMRHCDVTIGAGFRQCSAGRNATNEAIKEVAIEECISKSVRRSSAFGEDVEDCFDLVRIVKLVKENPYR